MIYHCIYTYAPPHSTIESAIMTCTSTTVLPNFVAIPVSNLYLRGTRGVSATVDETRRLVALCPSRPKASATACHYLAGSGGAGVRTAERCPRDLTAGGAGEVSAPPLTRLCGPRSHRLRGRSSHRPLHQRRRRLWRRRQLKSGLEAWCQPHPRCNAC